LIRQIVIQEVTSMLFRTLHRLGIPSDVFYFASLGSIAASIAAWAVRKDERVANAERLGIFIGLWAPTFMLLGQGVHTLESVRGLASGSVEQAAQRVEGMASDARETAQASVRS
jgi:hypothetical protein